jgi:hypothetical protein
VVVVTEDDDDDDNKDEEDDEEADLDEFWKMRAGQGRGGKGADPSGCCMAAVVSRRRK